MRYHDGQQHLPCWIDLAVGDVEGASDFYAAMFGWERQDVAIEGSSYGVWARRGSLTAGVRKVEDTPARRSVYFSVASLEAAMGTAQAAGGRTLDPPSSIGSLSRTATVADPIGAGTSLWEPGSLAGFEAVNEPGTVTWVELSTTDRDRAKTFYSTLFEWEWVAAGVYAVAHLGAEEVAGLTSHSGAEDQWLFYLASADVTVDAERVVALGGDLIVEPTKVPGFCELAAVRDPLGAGFGLIRYDT